MTKSAKLNLLKAAGLIGLLTLVSRVLGMIRDIVSAQRFGTSWQWDAFIYAFMLPNFMRRLVGEGALSSAFIPVYAELIQKEGKASADRFANIVFTLLFLGLAAFLLLIQGLLFFVTHSFVLPPAVHLTCGLLQVFFPYLLFISLCALAMGILNTHHHYFSPTLSPIILDIVWIAGVLWVSSLNVPEREKQVSLLAIWILASGAIQLGVQIPYLLQIGFRPQMVFDFLHPALKQVGRLILPAILGFAIVQINILVDMTLGFWVGPGANSSLWYANRLMQFPLGVFAIAMGTVLLPTISHHAARREMEEAKRTLSFALRSVFFIILPSTAGLTVLAKPIVQLLFERGEFDVVSTARTSFTLICYTVGLFAYSGQKLVVTGFYSLQDTKTPMKIGVVALILNIVFNLILMGPLKEGGLALATSISGVFNFLALMYIFQKRVGDFRMGEILTSSARILGASLGMGVSVWFLYPKIYGGAAGDELVRLLAGVFGSIGLSVGIYLGLCLLFRVPELHEVIRWLFRERRKGEITEKVGEEPL